MLSVAPGPVRLAQAEPLFTIDKILAQAILDALDILVVQEEIPEGWASEECWRTLRIRRWGAMVAFRDRLVHFMGIAAQRLQITEAEEKLIGEVMNCIDTLLAKQSAEVESTVEFASTLVGVLGGLIAVIVAVGLA
jgi:hypothetical protein